MTVTRDEMSELPRATMKRLIEKAVSGHSDKIRVSKRAALELASILEEQALSISGRAVELTRHRGARTVTKSDILCAAGMLEVV